MTYLQNGLPLIPRPFDVLAAKSRADNADLLVRIQRLKKEGTFGGIKAILEPRAFHYQSAWVAMRLGEKHQVSPEDVPKEQQSVRLGEKHQVFPEDVPNEQQSARRGESSDARLEVLWQHPGVIYGCEREHEFNLWFFIAVPAGYDLEVHVRCLAKLSGAQRFLFLPVCKVFKGNDLLSSLDAEIFPAMSECFEKRQTVGSSNLMERLGRECRTPAETVLKDWFLAEEVEMIRQLQEPFPLTDEPYRKIAVDLGITEAQALERIKSLIQKGCLKRIGSFSKPSGVVSAAKTLVVWQIPEEKLERIGPEIAKMAEVLCADGRPAFSEFPYSLYTMVRAGTSEEIEALVRRIQEHIGKWPHRVLVTTRELKKKKMNYFPKELDAWWHENRHAVETAFHENSM